MSTVPPNEGAPLPPTNVGPPAPAPVLGTPPGPAPTEPAESKLGLIALIVAVVGFIFGVIPGALIIGWILLPIAFILSLVALFQKGKKTKAIIALIVTIVGFIASAIAFFAVVDKALTEAFDEVGSDTQVVQQDEVAEEVPKEAEPAEAPAAEAGTRDNPAALGDEIVADNWTVVVNAVTPDATAEVLEASMVNSEPDAGMQYLVANVTATYTGDEKGNTLEVSVAFVSDTGEVYKSSDTLVIAPDPTFLMDELYTGASDTGNVAIAVPSGAAGTLRVTPGLFADEVFVAIN